MASSTPSPPDRLRSLLPATTQSQDETQSLGASLGRCLDPGAVVALYGELGTGKTHLVKGIARALGLSPSTVRSPTFTILHTYEDGRRPLHHFDAYRVQTPDEFVELGFEEYVADASGLTCIEWADRVETLLPASALRLELAHVAPRRRRIALRSEAPAPD
ncbi:MAG: tRNA (adenosine(37)-N6)-threonylcarbamoyltransferase complex ATPase subunit type 1 TsaE [Salinibacter sp.]